MASAVRLPHRWAEPKIVMPVVIGVAALAFWIPYSVRAGFVYDDWASAAGHQFHLGLFTSYRPGFIVWEALAVRLFGTDPLGYYLSSAVLMSAMAVLAVVALDGLGLPPLASGAVGLLVVVSPYADSLGLWWTATQMSLAMVLALAAIAAGSRWMNRRPHAGVHLGISLALLVAATITYEAVAPIVLLPVALIAFADDRRRVLQWTAPAVVAAGFAALVMFERAVSPLHKTARPLAQYPARIESLVHSGTTTMLHHLVGLFTVADVLVACTVAAACYGGWRALQHRETGGGPPLSWIGISLLLLIDCTYLSWVPFIPADDYYLPGQFGLGNRVNLLAQLFFLTAVIVALGGVAKVVGRNRRAAAVIVAALFAGVFASFFSQTHQDQQDYLFAQSQRQRVISDVKQLLPRVDDGDEILLAGYHLTASPQWVPVLSATWDTSGALDLLYGTGSILAQPVSTDLGCAVEGLTQPPLEGVGLVPYGRVVVVDISGHYVERMPDRARCRRELPTLTVEPNPILESPST
jgi:hypothetical protein